MSARAPDAALRSDAAGKACVLFVHAQPGARAAGKLALWNGRLKLSLAAAPIDGRANRELLLVLARLLGLRQAQLELLTGPAQRDKTVRIHAGYALVRARLAELLSRQGSRP